DGRQTGSGPRDDLRGRYDPEQRKQVERVNYTAQNSEPDDASQGLHPSPSRARPATVPRAGQEEQDRPRYQYEPLSSKEPGLGPLPRRPAGLPELPIGVGEVDRRHGGQWTGQLAHDRLHHPVVERCGNSILHRWHALEVARDGSRVAVAQTVEPVPWHVEKIEHPPARPADAQRGDDLLLGPCTQTGGRIAGEISAHQETVRPGSDPHAAGEVE